MLNALIIQGHPHTIATRQFISHMDDFFDCLNVSHTYTGQKKLKPMLYPYTSTNDNRFEVNISIANIVF